MTRAGSVLARVLLICGALSLLAMLLLTCVDVAGRYLFSAPINGKTELTRFLMAGLIACALPVVSSMGEQISVDLFDRYFSARAGAVRDLIIDVVVACAFFVLGYWLLFRAARLLKRGYVSDFLHLPIYPVAYFIAAMVFVSALALTLKLVIDGYYVAHPEQRPAPAAGPAIG